MNNNRPRIHNPDINASGRRVSTMISAAEERIDIVFRGDIGVKGEEGI